MIRLFPFTTRFYSNISLVSKPTFDILLNDLNGKSSGLMQEYLFEYKNYQRGHASRWIGISIVYDKSIPIGWNYMTPYRKIGMFVDSRYRNRGIGTRMAKFLIRKCSIDLDVISGYDGIGKNLHEQSTGLRIIKHLKNTSCV